MNNKLRSLKQTEFAEIYEKNNRLGIILSSIRFGKTRLALQTINVEDTVLITYPFTHMKKDIWEKEMREIHFDKELTFSTFASLKTLVKLGIRFDQIICDEVHKLSPANILSLSKLHKGKILGLTGTLRNKSEDKLRVLGLGVIARYSLEDAIKDGLVKDYKVIIHYIDMNAKDKVS